MKNKVTTLQFVLFIFLVLSCNSRTSKINKESEKIPKEQKERIHPQRANQRFITASKDGDTLTVKSFNGESGIEYPTYEEAYKNNNNKFIIIKNVEYGGSTEWGECYLVGGINKVDTTTVVTQKTEHVYKAKRFVAFILSHFDSSEDKLLIANSLTTINPSQYPLIDYLEKLGFEYKESEEIKGIIGIQHSRLPSDWFFGLSGEVVEDRKRFFSRLKNNFDVYKKMNSNERKLLVEEVLNRKD